MLKEITNETYVRKVMDDLRTRRIQRVSWDEAMLIDMYGLHTSNGDEVLFPGMGIATKANPKPYFDLTNITKAGGLWMIASNLH